MPVCLRLSKGMHAQPSGRLLSEINSIETWIVSAREAGLLETYSTPRKLYYVCGVDWHKVVNSSGGAEDKYCILFPDIHVGFSKLYLYRTSLLRLCNAANPGAELGLLHNNSLYSKYFMGVYVKELTNLMQPKQEYFDIEIPKHGSCNILVDWSSVYGVKLVFKFPKCDVSNPVYAPSLRHILITEMASLYGYAYDEAIDALVMPVESGKAPENPVYLSGMDFSCGFDVRKQIISFSVVWPWKIRNHDDAKKIINWLQGWLNRPILSDRCLSAFLPPRLSMIRADMPEPATGAANTAPVHGAMVEGGVPFADPWYGMASVPSSSASVFATENAEEDEDPHTMPTGKLL